MVARAVFEEKERNGQVDDVGLLRPSNAKKLSIHLSLFKRKVR